MFVLYYLKYTVIFGQIKELVNKLKHFVTDFM